MNTEQFILKSKERYGDKFDYSLSVYVNSKVRIKIICPTHGIQEVFADNHLKTKTGCNGCGIAISAEKLKGNIQEIVEKAKSVHGDKYSYEFDNYINRHTKVKIWCKKHEICFEQTIASHLNGNGCKLCANELSSMTRTGKLKYTEEEILNKSKEVWGEDRWDYSNFKFTGSTCKVILKCNNCGEVAKQFVFSHLNKITPCSCKIQYSGWSKTDWIELCNKRGFDYPSVYIVQLHNNDETFIKIGFTTNKYERFKQWSYGTHLLNEIIGKPEAVYNLEKKLHKAFKQYKYKPLQKFGGETECFSTEILKDSNFQLFLQN